MSHQTAKETIPKERDDRHVWVYFFNSLNISQGFGGPADLENILSFQNEGEPHWTLAWHFAARQVSFHSFATSGIRPCHKSILGMGCICWVQWQLSGTLFRLFRQPEWWGSHQMGMILQSYGFHSKSSTIIHQVMPQWMFDRVFVF